MSDHKLDNPNPNPNPNFIPFQRITSTDHRKFVDVEITLGAMKNYQLIK